MPPPDLPIEHRPFTGVVGTVIWLTVWMFGSIERMNPLLQFISMVIGIFVAILTGVSVLQSIKIKRLKIKHMEKEQTDEDEETTV